MSQRHVFAHAKINLHLHITGRMANGYHTLDSLVAFTDLHDDITVIPSDAFKLTVTDEHGNDLSLDCNIEDNLVSRATLLLAKNIGVLPNVHIKLIKRIPVSAGLGGGSADAAVTLCALKDLWSPHVTFSDIEICAAELGSDIVACLYKKPLIMRGIGNTIIKAPELPTAYGIFVNPNIPCPTPQVYKTYSETNCPFNQDIIFPEKFISVKDLCTFLNQNTSNDLTDAAVQTAPVIQSVLQELEKLPDCLMARLSGSGATCFAIFENKEAAKQYAEHISQKYASWWFRQITINGN